MAADKVEFSEADLDSALAVLDSQIAKSKNLSTVLPIKIVATGGFVALKVLKNRQSTQDLNFILDPSIPDYSKMQEKLSIAIKSVAKSQGIGKKVGRRRNTQYLQ
ncbi:MAG: hypothetical protein M1814_003426 [Vezdaea aestivalis]|nr:MAG: hypothetical protein M1814_003426 [Vezdaea aestivalis]